MEENDISSILDAEELELFKKIEAKFVKYFDEQAKESKTDEELLSFDSKDDYIHPQSITGAPVEIMFHIKAVVTEIDEKGMPKETIEAMDKFYHIPISKKDQYKKYVDNFLEHFHTKLEKTCQEIKDE